MTTRWWAPEGPHIGPDERDFELLIPLDNARHDLGAALLALHRVGAAACEEVALHAIPDEVSLVSALASARQAFAAPLVESVSKSVGEGPYAGLLVRDTIDDAESGALLVFRTLASSGVPAAVAAQRAGMVYGVPEEGLTSFLSVAKELRAHPAALNDAADRALFTAIEKISLEESVDPEQPFEEVSKTTPENRTQQRQQLIPEDFPALIPDDPETPYYDARDASGRFARGSVTGPPEVGEAPARPKRASRATRATRSTRSSRSSRGHLQARQSPTQQREGASRRAPGRDAVRLRKSRQERTKAQADAVLADLEPMDMPQGSYLEPIERPATRGPFEQLDHEIAFAMSPQEWGELQGHLGRDDDGRLAFRMGHLAQQRDADRFGAASDYDLDEHRKKLGQIAKMEREKLERQFPHANLVEPVSVTVDDDEIANMEPLEARELINALRYDALVDHFTERGVDPYEPETQEEILRIIQHAMPSNRSPDNKGDVYTYVPPMTGDSLPANVKVIELVFDAGVRGRDEGRGKHSDYALDPNQLMRVENARPEIIYDPRIGAFRLRYYVNPDVSKAYDPDEPRDSGGRWARVQDRTQLIPEDFPTLVPEDAPTRQPVRSTRASRSKRATRVRPRIQPTRLSAASRNAPARESSQQRDAKRNRDIQHALNQLVLHRAKPRAYRELREDGAYKVMDQSAFQDLLYDHYHGQEEPGDPVNVTGPDRLALLSGTYGGKHADYTMKEMTDQAILSEQYGTPYVNLKLPNKMPPLVSLRESVAEVSAKIMDYADSLFQHFEDVDQILVDYHHEGDITFYGNMNPAPPVVLIEHDPTLDPAKPIQVIWDGELNTDDFVADFDEPITRIKQIYDAAAGDDDDDLRENDLLPLKITRPKVELWRVVNAPETDAQD